MFAITLMPISSVQASTFMIDQQNLLDNYSSREHEIEIVSYYNDSKHSLYSKSDTGFVFTCKEYGKQLTLSEISELPDNCTYCKGDTTLLNELSEKKSMEVKEDREKQIRATNEQLDEITSKTKNQLDGIANGTLVALGIAIIAVVVGLVRLAKEL